MVGTYGFYAKPTVEKVVASVPLVPAAAPPPTVVLPNFTVGQAVAYGKHIPIFAGHVRIPCENLWLANALTYSTGDKPMPFATYMVILGMPLSPDAARPILQLHANGNEIYNTATGLNVHGIQFAWYPGSTTQGQDPDHVADKGADYTPAYRHRACLKLKNFPTEPYGGTLPALTVTVKDTPGTSRMSVEALFKAYAEFKGFGADRLICEGLAGFEVDGMTTFDQDLSLKDFLKLHCPLFGADYFERGNDIIVTRKVVGSTYVVTKTLDESDLLPVDDDGAVHTDLPDDLDLPDHMELTYYALEVNFQRVPVYARTRVTNNPKWERVACCLVITPQEAQTYVTNLMLRIYQSAVRHRIKLSPQFQEIEPGDILAFSHKGRDYLTKVHAATLAADGLELELLNILTDESITAASGFGGEPTDPVITTPPGDPTLAPVNTSVPTITGSAVEGQTAARTLGSWTNSPTSYSTQWYRAGVAIAGATGATYTYVTADVGQQITVRVTATNAAGSATATSAPTTPVAAAPPDSVAPVINTSATHTVAENTAFSVTLTASESVTWTKTGGPDAALFTLTGALLEMAAKDYEIPTDADANGVYGVQVTATDAAGNTATKFLAVTVTNVAEDTTPNPFTFIDVDDAPLSTVYTSAPITVSGINAPTSITITGGAYDINASGVFVSSAGTVNNGDTVRVRVTSSASNSTAVNATVTIGGTVSDTYTVRTFTVAQLSSTDKHADVTLSGSNLTATAAASNTHKCAVAATHVYAGVYEWDVTVGTTVSDMGIGVCSPAHLLDTFPVNNQGIVLLNDGRVYNGAQIATGVLGGFTSGDIIRCHLDKTGGTIKWRKNGGSWSTAYTLGAMASASVPATPLFKLYNANSITANFNLSDLTSGAANLPGVPPSVGAYRYWRLFLGTTRGGAGNTVFSTPNVEFLIGGVDQSTSTAAASTTLSGTDAAYAFDEDMASLWASQDYSPSAPVNQWLRNDLGLSKAIDQASMQCRADAFAGQTASRWAVEYSDDTTTWRYAAAHYGNAFALGEVRSVTVPQ